MKYIAIRGVMRDLRETGNPYVDEVLRHGIPMGVFTSAIKAMRKFRDYIEESNPLDCEYLILSVSGNHATQEVEAIQTYTESQILNAKFT